MPEETEQYILKKDLPNRKVGTIFTWNVVTDMYMSEPLDNDCIGIGYGYLKNEVENNPEWFMRIERLAPHLPKQNDRLLETRISITGQMEDKIKKFDLIRYSEPDYIWLEFEDKYIRLPREQIIKMLEFFIGGDLESLAKDVAKIKSFLVL